MSQKTKACCGNCKCGKAPVIANPAEQLRLARLELLKATANFHEAVYGTNLIRINSAQSEVQKALRKINYLSVE